MRMTRRYFGCCISRCTSTTMVFSILALVTLPTSSVLLPRSVFAAVAACVSVVITPSLPSPARFRRSIAVPAEAFSRARDLSWLREGASALRLAPCSTETSGGKSAPPDPFRAPAIPLRHPRGTFQYAAPYSESSCAGDKFRRDRQLVRRKSQRLPRRRFVHPRHLKHDAPRLHHRYPLFRRAFALAHAGFRRLLG